MSVILTSPAEGKQPGEKYTGPREAFLLAEGYARRDRYNGPGVQNTGEASVKPSRDPRLAENAEDEPNVDLGTFQAEPREGAPADEEPEGEPEA